MLFHSEYFTIRGTRLQSSLVYVLESPGSQGIPVNLWPHSPLLTSLVNFQKELAFEALQAALLSMYVPYAIRL